MWEYFTKKAFWRSVFRKVQVSIRSESLYRLLCQMFPSEAWEELHVKLCHRTVPAQHRFIQCDSVTVGLCQGFNLFNSHCNNSFKRHILLKWVISLKVLSQETDPQLSEWHWIISIICFQKMNDSAAIAFPTEEISPISSIVPATGQSNSANR